MADFDIISNKSKHKAHLDDIGVKTLPDQPGKRGFSAEEVKTHFKAPIDYLFSLLAKSMGQADDCFKGYDFSITEINSELERLDKELSLKNIVFTPALQSDEPDTDTNHVWLDTNGSFEDEVPKTETIDLNLETNELTIGGESLSLSLSSDDALSLALGNDGGTILSADDPITLSSGDDDTTIILN